MIFQKKTGKIDLKKAQIKIESSADACLEIPNQLEIINYMGADELSNLHLVRDLYQESKVYSFELEALFGDIIVNG